MTDLNAFLFRDPNASGGAKGHGGQLAGITVGVKANIAVAGMPFHAGIGAWADKVAERDAQVVQRLREEGASIVGILNMEEAALGAKTDNPHFGATLNPHRAKGKGAFSPGGSSGGSGASVAAGECDVALGTDTMGSVRIPAAHCGVYGFKPATTRVSQNGLIPADPSLDAIGPLARDLALLERVSRIVSDFGVDDPRLGGATLAEHGVNLNSDVEAAFRRALAALDHPEACTLSHPLSRIRFAGFIEVSKWLAQELAGVAVSDWLARLLTYGPKRSAADWVQDRAILDRTCEEVRQLVKAHGFLVLPTVPNPPFLHSEPEPAAQADFTCLANIAGLPAISLPAGWTGDGLPVGVQIIGEPGAEAGLFRLAHQLDDKLNAYRPPQ